MVLGFKGKQAKAAERARVGTWRLETTQGANEHAYVAKNVHMDDPWAMQQVLAETAKMHELVARSFENGSRRLRNAHESRREYRWAAGDLTHAANVWEQTTPEKFLRQQPFMSGLLIYPINARLEAARLYSKAGDYSKEDEQLEAAAKTAELRAELVRIYNDAGHGAIISAKRSDSATN